MSEVNQLVERFFSSPARYAHVGRKSATSERARVLQILGKKKAGDAWSDAAEGQEPFGVPEPAWLGLPGAP